MATGAATVEGTSDIVNKYGDDMEKLQSAADKGDTRALEEAAKQGSRVAQHHLGQIYFSGRGVEVDLNKAAYWFERAAEELDESPNWLKDSIRNIKGWSGEMDEVKAKTQVKLWEMYSTNRNPTGKPNFDKAMRYLTMAAGSGYSEAKVILGDIYLRGKYGFPQDDRKAEYWLGKQPRKTESGPSDDQQTTGEGARREEDLKPETVNYLVNSMESLFKRPNRSSRITERVLDKELIARYAIDSPTAKKCLDAYNSYTTGFNILQKSDYENPESLRYLVVGCVLEPTLLNNVFNGTSIYKYDKFILDQNEKMNILATFLIMQGVNGENKGREQLLIELNKSQEIDSDLKIKMMGYLQWIIGTKYGRNRQYPLALAAFDRSWKLDPTSVGTLVDIGMAHMYMGLEDSDRTGLVTSKMSKGDSEHYTTALRFFDKFLEVAPKCDRKYPEALYNKAYLLLLRGGQRWTLFYEMAIESDRNHLPFLDRVGSAWKGELDMMYPLVKTPSCASCGKQTRKNKKLLLCPCGDVYYCGSTCQGKDLEKHRKSCSVLNAKVCSYCRRPQSTSNQLKRCVACHKVAYCGKECQKAGWKSHKPDCKK